jgi:hypothetical protein
MPSVLQSAVAVGYSFLGVSDEHEAFVLEEIATLREVPPETRNFAYQENLRTMGGKRLQPSPCNLIYYSVP